MPNLKMGSAAAAFGAFAALAVAVVGRFEGLSLVAYPDPATGGRPFTVCFGHATGVKPGDRYSLAECKAMLQRDLLVYWTGIYSCTSVPLRDETAVALTSFAYNVGVSTACKSSVVRLINQGHPKQGCNALLQYNKANGVVFPGLTTRRRAERELCLKGVM